MRLRFKPLNTLFGTVIALPPVKFAIIVKHGKYSLYQPLNYYGQQEGACTLCAVRSAISHST